MGNGKAAYWILFRISYLDSEKSKQKVVTASVNKVVTVGVLPRP